MDGPPPRVDNKKYYRLLGVDQNASAAVIKKSYQKLAMEHHPDRGGDAEMFKGVARAYEVLSNAKKREIYDTYGEDGVNNMEQGGNGRPEVDPFEIFKDIFGFDLSGQQAGQRARAVSPDNEYDFQLRLEELYNGCQRKLVFNRNVLCGDCNGVGGYEVLTCSACGGTGRTVTMQQIGPFVNQVQVPCSSCNGEGKTVPPRSICRTCRGKTTVVERMPLTVDVVPGAEHGEEYRFRGLADELPDHETGDVVIRVREKTHKVYQRVGEMLFMSKTISLAEALCGFQFTTPFLDGTELVVHSAPGEVMKPSDVMVIRNKGMPRRDSRQSGDLFIKFDVDFPSHLPRETHEALRGALGAEEMPLMPPDAPHMNKLSARQAAQLRRRITAQAQRTSRGGQQVGCQQQ